MSELRSWLYREFAKFYMREKNINGHYLAVVLQVFSDSANLARFLPPICHQVPLAGSVWFLTPICWHRIFNRFCQIFNSLATSFDITDSIWNLLSFCYQILIAYSISADLAIWVIKFWIGILDSNCIIITTRRCSYDFRVANGASLCTSGMLVEVK